MEERRKIAEATKRALADVILNAYEDAGLSGLCAEGRWEVALGVLRDFDLTGIVETTER